MVADLIQPMRQFFDNGFSECQEMQTWPFHGDGDARASNEMRFIPAVTDHIPTMHVTGDNRRLAVQAMYSPGRRASVSNSRLTNK